MTFIREKLDVLYQKCQTEVSRSELMEILGNSFEEDIIYKKNEKWGFFPFKEDNTLFLLFLRADRFQYERDENGALIVSSYKLDYYLPDQSFYTTITDELFSSLKEYRAYCQKQLVALDIIFSDKKFRLKGLI